MVGGFSLMGGLTAILIETTIAAKKFVKPLPEQELRREIEIFCDLFTRPAVEAGLRKFMESTDALPYLP